MADNKFYIFDENNANVQTDAEFLADAQRLSGLTAGQARTVMHNKLFRQVSFMASAIAQCITDILSVDTTDSSFSTLVTNFKRAFGSTTADVTYYVNASTGSDSNDGLASGTAFLTIQHAIDIIPQIVNHSVTINVASGTYTGGIRIYGFTGKGLIYVLGDTTVSSSRVVDFINVYQCSCGVIVKGFNPTYSIAQAVYCDRCTFVSFEWINITSSSSTQYGFFIANGRVEIVDSNISNRGYAVCATQLADVKCTSLTGTGNVVSLASNYGSNISLVGTQPSGTTTYSMYSGTITDVTGNPITALPIAGGAMTGMFKSAYQTAQLEQNEGQSTFQVMGDSTHGAFLSFHRAGLFACNVGIDTSNDLCVGGWSMGANKYKILHTGNITISTAAPSATLAEGYQHQVY